jgi:hypothetical protein
MLPLPVGRAHSREAIQGGMAELDVGADSQRAVTALEESELAALLLGAPEPWRRWPVLYWLGLSPGARAWFRLGPPFVDPEGIPGDLDALLCDPATPERAVAFECKRVKVKPETFATGQPNKLQELAHGAAQANGLLRQGYHRVYLLVGVAVDGSERGGSWLDRGLTTPLLQTIYGALPPVDLDARVGVLVSEMVQTVADPVHQALAAQLDVPVIRLAGSGGLQQVRAATPHAQSEAMTHAVRALVAGGAT